MGLERLIPEGTLAQLWRVHHLTPYYWRVAGRISSDVRERAPRSTRQSHFYWLSTIDAYHAQCAVGFGSGTTIPTTSDLLGTGNGLLTTSESAALIGRSIAVLQRRVKLGVVPAFWLAPQKIVRFPAAILTKIASDDSLVHPDVVAKVLCQGKDTVRELIASRRLRTAYEPSDAKQLYVMRASLIELLRELLPPFLQPEAWWQECLMHNEPALSRVKVMQQYHFGNGRLQRYLDSGQLPYISTPGNGARRHIRIPAQCVRDLMAGQRPLDATELAGIFPVSTSMASEWIRKRSLCTKPHAGLCPNQQCVEAYIENHRTHADLTPEAWLQQCQRDRMAPIHSEELVATTPGSSEEDIHEGVTNGQLRGVWLPSHEGIRGLAIMRTDAVVWRRMQERRLYRDYHLRIDEV